jgi:hypothetical protein
MLRNRIIALFSARPMNPPNEMTCVGPPQNERSCEIPKADAMQSGSG